MNIDYDFIPECKNEIEEAVNNYLKRSLKVSITNLTLNLPSREDIFKIVMDELKTERKDIFYNKDPENYWKNRIINYKEVDKDPTKYFNDFINSIVFRTKIKAKYFFKLVNDTRNIYTVKISVVETVSLSNRGVYYDWFEHYLRGVLCSSATWGRISDGEWSEFQPLNKFNFVTIEPTIYFESSKIKKLEQQQEIIFSFVESREFTTLILNPLLGQLKLKKSRYSLSFKVTLFNNFKDIFPEVKNANLKKANKFFETPTRRTLNKVLKLDSSFEFDFNHLRFETITIKQKEECSPTIIFFRTRIIDLESKIDKISFTYESFLLRLLNDLNVPVNKTNLTKALNLIEISLF